MKTKSSVVGRMSVKLLASILLVACLVIGAVGLILPIVPGLLFLAIAAVIAAKHFPSIGRRLRRNRALGRRLDRGGTPFGSTFWRKVQLGALIGVKTLLDALSRLGSTAGTRRARTVDSQTPSAARRRWTEGGR